MKQKIHAIATALPFCELKVESLRFKAAYLPLSLISFLKRLWKRYITKQAYRKELQRRFLRRKAFLKVKSVKLKVESFSKLKVESSMFKVALVVIILFTGGFVKAQTLKPLNVGEQVPEVVITHLLGFGQKEVKLSELRGKVVLIDFWSIYCGSCIANMPHLQSLQNQFKDSLVVLPINAEQQEKITKLWGVNPILKKLPIYSVYGDTVLSQLFPHRLFPHLVWIDQNGIYLGATSVEYANAEHIKRVYEGKPIGGVAKTDQDLFDAKTVSLPAYFNADTSTHFFPYLKGMSGQGGKVLEADSSLRYYVINTQMANLYAVAIAYRGLPFEPKRRMIDLADAQAYEYQTTYGYSDDWKAKYAFSYERVFPKGTKTEDINRTLLADLNQHFNLEGKIKERDIPVLALRKKDCEAGVITSATKGTRIKNWMNSVNTLKGLDWMVDETGLGENYLMPPFPIPDDLTSLKETLAKYGFVLVPSHQMLPIFYLQNKTLTHEKNN